MSYTRHDVHDCACHLGIPKEPTVTDPTDETRPDREALAMVARRAYMAAPKIRGMDRLEGWRKAVDAVLALIPAQPARPAEDDDHEHVACQIDDCPDEPDPPRRHCGICGGPMPAENLGSAHPAPHPLGDTETLRLIVALHAIYPTSGLCGVCGTYWPCDTVMLARPGEIAARAKLAGFWEGHPELAALLAAAPAPTEAGSE